MPGIRVLYIEDSPEDRELVTAILTEEKDDPAFIVHHVDTLEQLAAELDAQSFDVVLSDFHFPGFDGFRVLERVSAHTPDLPVVFVTITGREQLAVDALKGGAADYVVKTTEQLPRLPRALRRAIETRRIAHDAREREARLLRQRGALLELTAETAQGADQYARTIRRICESASDALGVRRVGLWRYDWSGRQLHSVDVWDATLKTHSEGTELSAEEFPSYFRAIAQFDFIAAHDAHTDPRTCEFSATYLTSHGITSMLDAPVRFSQSRAGVLCFEHVGPARRWTADEEAFAISVANLVALLVERSERQAIERERRRNEAMLAEAERIADLGSWEMESVPGQPINALPLRWSDQLYRILGYPPRAMAASYAAYLAHIPSEEMPLIQEVASRLFERHETIHFMHRIRRVDGAERIVRVRAAPVFGGDDRLPRQFLGTIQDVTERERAASIAREAAQFSQLIIDNTHEGIAVVDANLRYQVFNPFLEELSGFRAADMIGNVVDDVVPAHDLETFKPLLQRALRGETVETSDLQLPALAGKETAWVTMRLSPLRDADAKINGALVLVSDITQRKQVEQALQEQVQALRESEARFRHMADHAPVMIWVTDAEGKATYLSRSWMDVTGQTEEETLDFGWVNAVHPDDRIRAKEEFLKALAKRERVTIDYRLRRRDGTYGNVIDASVPRVGPNGEYLGYIGSVIDVTDRLRLEEQLRQAQKMEAIGQLSGGVAHDFNNLLTVIKGHAGLLQSRNNLDPQVGGPIREIASAADRAASLTRQLLTLSRQEMLRPARHNLTSLISNLTQILQRLLTENIALELKLWPEPLPIHADEGMIEQVLLNFVVNARDAMPRGGKLEIATACATLNGDESHMKLRVQPGTFAVLCVSDTGVGIAPGVIGRVFEPFFTTKGLGKGTGLGLATVYGILQQHRGTISVESEVGKGTTIRAYFPLLKDQVPAPAAKAESSPPTGHETILFVEDEPAVREVGVIALQMLGYRVLPANDATHALQVWEAHKHEIALLATDLVMPGNLNGQELAARLRTERPKLPVIFISGYCRDAIGTHLPSSAFSRHLPKPFDIATLASLVREALDGAG